MPEQKGSPEHPSIEEVFEGWEVKAQESYNFGLHIRDLCEGSAGEFIREIYVGTEGYVRDEVTLLPSKKVGKSAVRSFSIVNQEGRSHWIELSKEETERYGLIRKEMITNASSQKSSSLVK